MQAHRYVLCFSWYLLVHNISGGIQYYNEDSALSHITSCQVSLQALTHLILTPTIIGRYHCYLPFIHEEMDAFSVADLGFEHRGIGPELFLYIVTCLQQWTLIYLLMCICLTSFANDDILHHAQLTETSALLCVCNFIYRINPSISGNAQSVCSLRIEMRTSKAMKVRPI